MEQIDASQLIRSYLNNNYTFQDGVLTFTFPTEKSIESFKKTIGDIKITENDNKLAVSHEGYKISFKGSNIIDVLGIFYPVSYGGTNPDPLYNFLYTLTNNVTKQLPYLIWFKNDPDAVEPTKAHYSDAGYDLTIIKKVKDIGENIVMYDTGISLQIPVGYRISIHPRSSLSKSGYILSNSTGIIDLSYTGNLFICLTRVDKSLSELKLPFKCCQIVLEKCEYCHFVEGCREDVVETTRNSGGFGSSDTKDEEKKR